MEKCVDRGRVWKVDDHILRAHVSILQRKQSLESGQSYPRSQPIYPVKVAESGSWTIISSEPTSCKGNRVWKVDEHILGAQISIL